MYGGRSDRTDLIFGDYRGRFNVKASDEKTIKAGKELLDEMSEAQRRKWQYMVESTDCTHRSIKLWKIFHKLTKYHTAPQEQYKVTANHVAHQHLRHPWIL